MPFTPEKTGTISATAKIGDLRPAVFLDRDGVLIEERSYIKNPDDVALIEGSVRALKPFVLDGYFIIIVSNQSGIGRGLVQWDDVFAVQQRLRDLWHNDDLSWDMALICPHHPVHGQGEYLQDNDWRKPHTGMFEFAARTLPVDLEKSIMVGDKLTDLQAAHDAGIRNLVHVLSGHGTAERAKIAQWEHSGRVTSVSSIADLSFA